MVEAPGAVSSNGGYVQYGESTSSPARPTALRRSVCDSVEHENGSGLCGLCPSDCVAEDGGGCCGDLVCGSGEGENGSNVCGTCPADCALNDGVNGCCGNAVCDSGEGPSGFFCGDCDHDCGSPACCGNLVCEPWIGESAVSCILDRGPF